MAHDSRNVEEFMKDVASAATDEGFKDYSNGKMPSAKEVWSLVEQMNGLSSEERSQLYESLFNAPSNHVVTSRSIAEYTVFLAMIALIVVVFGLFGYKLYRSLTERELKRKEKKKQKQKNSKKTKKSN